MTAECPKCNRDVALTAMTVKVSGRTSEYVCDCGGVPVAINPDSEVQGYMLNGNSESFYGLLPAKILWLRAPGVSR